MKCPFQNWMFLTNNYTKKHFTVLWGWNHKHGYGIKKIKMYQNCFEGFMNFFVRLSKHLRQTLTLSEADIKNFQLCINISPICKRLCASYIFPVHLLYKMVAFWMVSTFGLWLLVGWKSYQLLTHFLLTKYFELI